MDIVLETVRLEQRLNYQFKNKALLQQALTHRSVSQKSNYERLEYLGDSLLSSIIAQYLYQRFTEDDEGKLTRMRATLVRQETLAKIAQHLDLGPRLILSPGEKKSGGHGRESILADVVEALIGAIWLDCEDLHLLKKIVMQWFDPFLGTISPTAVLKDPKTRLQEWLQARHLPLPQYHLVNVEGDAPKQFFTIQCTVKGISKVDDLVYTGKGTSRRNAEQTAASLILGQLEQLT